MTKTCPKCGEDTLELRHEEGYYEGAYPYIRWVHPYSYWECTNCGYTEEAEDVDEE
jgi:ribosomal protein S27AE